MPQFNFWGPPKSKMFYFQRVDQSNLRFSFQFFFGSGSKNSKARGTNFLESARLFLSYRIPVVYLDILELKNFRTEG